MLRNYQEELAKKSADILSARKIVYLAMEMRVGKTLISLRAAELVGARKVLFVTKKKAISSIEKDYRLGGFGFEIKITNYEQLSKVKAEFDVIIVDEAHSLGAFPRPSQRTQRLRAIVGDRYLILLSGTPTPESESQIYHQFWISRHSPFRTYKNFYSWAKKFVNIREVKYNGVFVRDYKLARKNEILEVVAPYMLRFTQQAAGFIHSDIDEAVFQVPIDTNIHRLVRILLKNRYYRFLDGEEIVCDTSVKLQNKIHQIYSGTVKTESGVAKVLDKSKALYIKEHYTGQKFAVFYKFKAEGDVLKEVIGNWTDNPDEFRLSGDKVFICQIASGAMGVNLSTADVLLFYNIDFSALLYWQARARVAGLERERRPEVHWLFAKGGIEEKIYRVVQQKKDYTLQYFIEDFKTYEGSEFAKKHFEVFER